jgi:hypothetical protein
VPLDVIVWRCRSRQYELASHWRTIINLTANEVPQCRLDLPFIEENRSLIGEENPWGCVDERSSPTIDVESKFAPRQSPCRLGLAAGLRALNEYCPG